MYIMVRTFEDGCEDRIIAKVATIEEAITGAKSAVAGGERRVEIYESKFLAIVEVGRPELHMVSAGEEGL